MGERARNDDPVLPDDLIAIARITRARGRRGEVLATLETDFPERFEGLRRIQLVDRRGVREAELERDGWLHNGRIVLKLRGVEDIPAARALAGTWVAVPESEAVPLDPGEYYHHQLVGLEVCGMDGARVGRVTSVLRGPAADCLVVDVGGRETLVPMVAAICREVDLEAGRVRIDPPEGLLEV